MPRSVELSEIAEEDLSAALEYYAVRSERVAKFFLSELDSILERIQQMPLQFPVFHRSFRRALFSKFPYAVVFAIEEEQFLVLALQHLKREPNYWMPKQ